jgi:tRNA dimethylallyltransferase
MKANKNLVVIIVGPTAVGKTDMAIRLAETLNGEIISADSRLLYKGMDIGTAKPTSAELNKVPHHLIDQANPDDIWSLAQYQQSVHQKIIEILTRKKLPIVVGGTGQYIRSLVEGWVIPPQAPNDKMRSALEDWAEQITPFALYQKLSIVDPVAAEKIDPTNKRRTVRALEVIFLTGKKFSDLKEKSTPIYNFLTIGLSRPRVELYQRIDDRIDEMFSKGLVDEVKKLLNLGYSENLPTLSAIGYAEAVGVTNGTLSIEEAKTIMKRRTRQFVRRQTNWFKPGDQSINWFEMNPDPFEDILITVKKGCNK